MFAKKSLRFRMAHGARRARQIGVEALKALAHPLRVRIFSELTQLRARDRERARGPAGGVERLDELPPPPAREARLRARGRGARQRPRPVVGARAGPDRARRRRRSPEPAPARPATSSSGADRQREPAVRGLLGEPRRPAGRLAAATQTGSAALRLTPEELERSGEVLRCSWGYRADGADGGAPAGRPAVPGFPVVDRQEHGGRIVISAGRSGLGSAMKRAESPMNPMIKSAGPRAGRALVPVLSAASAGRPAPAAARSARVLASSRNASGPSVETRPLVVSVPDRRRRPFAIRRPASDRPQACGPAAAAHVACTPDRRGTRMSTTRPPESDFAGVGIALRRRPARARHRPPRAPARPRTDPLGSATQTLPRRHARRNALSGSPARFRTPGDRPGDTTREEEPMTTTPHDERRRGRVRPSSCRG